MKTKKNNGVFYVAISLLGVLAIGTAVLAYSITKNINVQGNYINYEAAQLVDNSGDNSQTLGAISGPDYTGDYQSLNGFTTFIKSGGLADVTTTLACVKEPFDATSTVDLAEVIITAPATTTFALQIGTTTSATITGLTTTTLANNGKNIIVAPSITANTKGIVRNNVNTATGSGFYPGGTVTTMAVARGQYVCIVAGEGTGGSTQSLTDAGNSFKGTYVLRFTR